MLKRYFLFIAISFLLSLVSSFITNPKKANTLRTIILDAGHGGKDPGASCWGKACTEGDITLAITLKLGAAIEKEIPDVTVYYTRKDDTYPSLYYRADFANEKKGDLFVSIHCNSASDVVRKESNGTKTVTYYEGKGRKRKKLTKEVPVYKYVRYPNPVKGMETYLWIPDKNDQKTDAIAAKENAEIFNDPDYKKKYGGGVDINSPEFIAKAKLRTKKYFTRSAMLANLVQEEGANVGRNNREVKQRGVGIWVLQATAMPSVLVETGYINNPEEANYLKSTKGQLEMAALITKAIKRYKEEIEKSSKPAENGGTTSYYNERYYFRLPNKLQLV